MSTRPQVADALFMRAEKLAHDFSLFPPRESKAAQIRGLVPLEQIQERLVELEKLSVDEYIARTVQPSEDKSRLDARTIIGRLKGRILQKGDEGPLYWAEMVLECDDRERRIGILAQNRAAQNGVWMPEHHHKAVLAIREFTQRALPIVTFIDTPGADAGADANRQNQAHSISHLIAEMAQIDVPSVGIILGAGYSGGAIPLATANVLLSVRDGVFNTIQPPGLASIARKYDLSWQECAKYVGVSAYELFDQGYIDGIIDYVPGDRANLPNLRQAIFSSIDLIETGAMDFVRRSPFLFDHYRRSIERYLNPTAELRQLQAVSTLSLSETPTSQLNVFGVAYRYMRYLGLRRRISSITIESYGRLSESEIPKGDLQKRAEEDRRRTFEAWLAAPLELRYEERLQKTWKQYLARHKSRDEQPGRLSRWVFGTPLEKFEQVRARLCLDLGFYLYNLWKSDAPGNLRALAAVLRDPETSVGPAEEACQTVLDVIRLPELRERFAGTLDMLLVFDTLYDGIVANLKAVAREANEFNIIAEDSVRRLLEPALARADGASPAETEARFRDWMRTLEAYAERGAALKSTESWKKRVYPRLSEPLFAIVTFYLEHLLPRYYASQTDGRRYDGRISPRNIGMKDFWNRLTIAYHDLLIQDLLERYKRKQPIQPASIIERFFADFEELNRSLMTADPLRFPGFRLSIEAALARNIPPCGLITGIARMRGIAGEPRVGVAISNLAFQAGAFDMASAEKFCKLLLECMTRRLPVVCFISSGGMQTKEGAGALFSMPIVNDRLTRFVRDMNLPVVCFGFGDCTGGAQASFVTHPMVQTHYLSGTNMPFAGQIVVPSYLPSTATLSNYLSETPGAMKGLVTHPFWPDLDDRLREIDAQIPLPRETVEEVVTRVLAGRFLAEGEADPEAAAAAAEQEDVPDVTPTPAPVRRILIHARGCPAVKLVRKARECGIEVVLVQSDADMDSVAAEALGPQDALVCIGGNTPDESYLNAHSVIRVAERERVDAIHPGIGFLSENPHFAALCGAHGFTFVGPSVQSMELMGNKSNAINTAIALDVNVVPGSRGIVTTLGAARRLAGQIGYPLLIKAVHGGGGKGIQVVRHAEELGDLFPQIRAEARSAFGNSDVYLEKFIESMRHVEVQVLRDTHGHTQVLGLRDCSVQRNNQKVVEESGSSLLPATLEADVYRYAAAICDRIDYTGAGTIEFIFDLVGGTVYFMEMNTRLQIEHPVTEAVTGIDIVRAQFDIASGRSIADLAVRSDGYAMEVRVNAEMAVRTAEGRIAFKPSPGLVTRCALPERKGIQAIASIGEGKRVSPYYDNMVAQIVCHGADRTDAIAGLRSYLDEVHIGGIATNLPLLRRILDDAVFRSGDYDTRYLPRLLERIDIDALCAESAATADSATARLSTESLRIEGSDELKVLAPSAGVFYVSPSPSDPDLVRVGDVVDAQQKLCLLEAMKLFSPLNLASFNQGGQTLYDEARRYEIVRVVPTTGQSVNAGDLLFVVKPR